MCWGWGEHPLSLRLDFFVHSQAMAEQLAENYHNTWGRKKKQELEAKGKGVHLTSAQTHFTEVP